MKTNTLERNAKIYRDRIAEFGYGHPNYDPMHLRNNVPSPIRIGDVCTLTLNDGLQRVFSTTSPHDSEINSEELPPVPPFPVFSLDLQQECQSRVRQFPLFSKAAKGKEGSTSVFAGVPNAPVGMEISLSYHASDSKGAALHCWPRYVLGTRMLPLERFKQYTRQNHQLFETIASQRCNKQEYQAPDDLVYVTEVTMARHWDIFAFDKLQQSAHFYGACNTIGFAALGGHFGTWKDAGGDIFHRTSPPRPPCPLDQWELSPDLQSRNPLDSAQEEGASTHADHITFGKPALLATHLARTHLDETDSQSLPGQSYQQDGGPSNTADVPQLSIVPKSSPTEADLVTHQVHLDQCILFKALRIRERSTPLLQSGKNKEREMEEYGILVLEIESATPSSPAEKLRKKRKKPGGDEDDSEQRENDGEGRYSRTALNSLSKKKRKERAEEGQGSGGSGDGGRANQPRDSDMVDIDKEEDPMTILSDYLLEKSPSSRFAMIHTDEVDQIIQLTLAEDEHNMHDVRTIGQWLRIQQPKIATEDDFAFFHPNAIQELKGRDTSDVAH